jgi:hypothetical protein
MFALLVIVSLSYYNGQANQKEAKNKLPFESQIFEYKNDSLTQNIKVVKIHEDTLKVTISTLNSKRETSCVMKGIAIRDTIGDFLHEEETVRDEKGDVFSITNYRFFYNGTINILNIQIDRIDKNKLIYYEVDSIWASENPDCLLYSIGALRKK